MNVYVAIDAHFVRFRGAIYTDISFHYPYWREYLDLFEEVRPIARVHDVDELPAEGWKRADGPGVRFWPVTNYVGFWSFLKRAPFVVHDCGRAVRAGEALLLRWGIVAVTCWAWTLVYRKPYAFEFTSDSGESLRPVKNIQRFGFNNVLVEVAQWLSRRVAGGACAVSYVSRFVQQLYPSRRPDREWVFSGVQLRDGLITGPRPATSFRRSNWHVVSVGRLEPEKGHAVLIDALRQLIDSGANGLRATFIGPGREFEHLQAHLRALGLHGHIRLTGRVDWGPALWAYLDDADLFVLPSLTEGMPRALIEALARGVPAVGTRAGGIPELLDPHDLVPPSDAPALAACIRVALSDPQRLADMSRRGFERALEYEPETMRRRKHAFWRTLAERVRTWQAAHGVPHRAGFVRRVHASTLDLGRSQR